ncbi:MAG: paraquat-inducible protein A [Polyangia bacterium]
MTNAGRALTAIKLGLVSCRACGLLSNRGTLWQGGHHVAGCPRCGRPLVSRKQNSLDRTTALLAAAALLFVPANLLPMMTTATLLRQKSDTIMSGVVTLWTTGSWSLSTLVFVASVVVPALKIVGLTVLVVSTRRCSTWRQLERTRLYRLLELVGRWSMLDVFVMALLAALVRSPLVSVRVEPGAVAFVGVVVFTMLASISFDPRLIWDADPSPSRTRTRTRKGLP